MKIFVLDKVWAYMIASIIGFLEPISFMFLWLLIFIMVDMITGIYASLVEGKIITSHGLQKTVVKFIMYATSVFLLHGIDAYMITFTTLYLARIGCTLICGIELYSIFENMYRVTGNVVFKVLTQTVIKKVGNETGVDISEDTLKSLKNKKRKSK